MTPCRKKKKNFYSGWGSKKDRSLEMGDLRLKI